MNISKKESLFQPGQPVSPDRFKGREDIIQDVIKYFPAVKSGNPQHFFIMGKRGMGKTSLANYISGFARNNYSMVTAHIMNDGVHDIDELVIQIIERILNAIKPEKWSDKIFNLIGNYIESVGFGGLNIKFKLIMTYLMGMMAIGFGGLNIKFKPSHDELKNIKDNLAFYLSDLVNNFKDKDGLFIVIDDINGLSKTPQFANWYKSFADTLATSVENAQIGIMLTGDIETFKKLYNHNPSVNRIFHTHELKN